MSLLIFIRSTDRLNIRMSSKLCIVHIHQQVITDYGYGIIALLDSDYSITYYGISATITVEQFQYERVSNYEWNLNSPHDYEVGTTYQGPAMKSIAEPNNYIVTFGERTRTEYFYDTFYIYTLDSDGNLLNKKYENSGSTGWEQVRVLKCESMFVRSSYAHTYMYTLIYFHIYMYIYVYIMW